MKKFLIILGLFFIFSLKAQAEPVLEDIGIAKFGVLETIRDYAPVRVAPNVNAKRFSHLRYGIVLYTDKQTDDFYRIDFGDGKNYWIEKKYVELQAVIPEKRIQDIKKIEFKEDKKQISILIPLNIHNSYSFEETSDGLNFKLYDVKFSNAEAKIKKQIGSFNFSQIGTTLNMKYISPALFGYEAKLTPNGLEVEIKKIPKINRKKPLNNIKIVVDPGHGGEEIGVSAFGRNEKDVNLEIAKKLKKELSKKGANVYMTRTKDKYVGLYDRVNFAHKKKADILISIHQNSLANPKDVAYKHGVGVYYYNKEAYSLARNIQSALLKQSGFRDDGVNYASFAMNRPTKPVSVLVECGYLIDKNEMEKLTDKKFQKAYVRALANGVENYLKTIVAL